MAIVNFGYQNVPVDEADEKDHRRKLAVAVNGLLSGKANVTMDVTLAANAATTTITDARISYTSAIVPAMALTAHAAAEIAAGTLYVPQATILGGSAVIQHANNAQTDRTFRFVLIG